MSNERRQVAIACQGGGSHTAFTAGVLQELLPAVAASEDHRLVGLSGTSGGAFTATAGWYGLLAEDTTPTEALEVLWAELTASTPAEWALNESLVWGSSLETMGFPFPMVSPYLQFGSDYGQAAIADAVESAVDVSAIPELATEDAPELVVGAVDINAGTFETFTNGDVTTDALLASAAVPDLFEAVKIGGDYHWDGLFSQNPPVRDLLTVPPEQKPDDLWVVQINPQTSDEVPTTLREIADRRNELAGNLSLNQELHALEVVNEFVEAGHLPEKYRYVEVERLQLDRVLDYTSKLDRRAEFVSELVAHGQRTARNFLAGQTRISVS